MGRTTNWWRDLLFAVVVFLGVGIPLCRTLTYTNHWAVRINGGSEEANAIASKYGYRNLGQVRCIPSYILSGQTARPLSFLCVLTALLGVAESDL